MNKINIIISILILAGWLFFGMALATDNIKYDYVLIWIVVIIGISAFILESKK